MLDLALLTCRVLLIDDCLPFLNTLVKVLARYPWIQVVGTAPDGRKGLALATELRPDIVITDLVMPEIPGFKLLFLLRKAVPEAKLIALTLYDEKVNFEAALAAGADAFVSKYDLVNELLPALRHVVGQRKELPAVDAG